MTSDDVGVLHSPAYLKRSAATTGRRGPRRVTSRTNMLIRLEGEQLRARRTALAPAGANALLLIR